MNKHFLTRVKEIKEKIFLTLKNRSTEVFVPTYRIASIIKNDGEDNYEILAQIIGTASVIKMKPEEILVNDDLTSRFSPLDIRTLTYLGYLDINSPKYKILARRLSEKDNRIIFALRKKGSKNVEIKMANEISQDSNVLKHLDREDAHMVSYIAGTEHALKEKTEKEKLLKTNNKKD